MILEICVIIKVLWVQYFFLTLKTGLIRRKVENHWCRPGLKLVNHEVIRPKGNHNQLHFTHRKEMKKKFKNYNIMCGVAS